MRTVGKILVFGGLLIFVITGWSWVPSVQAVGLGLMVSFPPAWVTEGERD